MHAGDNMRQVRIPSEVDVSLFPTASVNAYQYAPSICTLSLKTTSYHLNLGQNSDLNRFELVSADRVLGQMVN